MAGLNDKRGMSLIEITIATMILSIVLLAAGSIYISSIRELNRCMDEAAVQKEASFLLDHIFLNLMGASDITSNAAGAWEDTDYATIITATKDSVEHKYEFKLADKKVEYYIAGALTETFNDVADIKFLREVHNSLTANIIKNFITVNLTVTRGRMTKTFSTGVTLRGMAG